MGSVMVAPGDVTIEEMWNDDEVVHAELRRTDAHAVSLREQPIGYIDRNAERRGYEIDLLEEEITEGLTQEAWTIIRSVHRSPQRARAALEKALLMSYGAAIAGGLFEDLPAAPAPAEESCRLTVAAPPQRGRLEPRNMTLFPTQEENLHI